MTAIQRWSLEEALERKATWHLRKRGTKRDTERELKDQCYRLILVDHVPKEMRPVRLMTGEATNRLDFVIEGLRWLEEPDLL